MNIHEFAELAAGHALDALSPEDAAAFAAALAEHPEWESIVETDAATVADLADGVAAVEPPAHIRGALLAAISAGGAGGASVGAAAGGPAAGDPGDTAPESEAVHASESDAAAETAPAPPLNTEAIQTVARRTWTRGLLALAASFVLLIALGTAAVTLGDRLRTPESVLALEQIQSAEDGQAVTDEVEGGGTATVHWSESLGKAVVVTSGVESAPRGETYELWFVRDGTPVSAGQFETDTTGAATTILDGVVEEGDVIAVTVEPDGGSPTGQPTSEPIVTLPTA